MLFAAEFRNRNRRPRLHVQRDPYGAVDAGDFLRNQRVGEKAKSVAAVVFGDQATEKTEIAHFGDEVFAEKMFFIVFRRGRGDLLLGEVARQFLNLR